MSPNVELPQSEEIDERFTSDQHAPAELDEVIPFKYSITSYGADYPVDGLVKRLGKKDIIIPQFQRGYVWSLKEASRFIESLLLGLPVPGIFLSRESDTQRLLVIDGQQRLQTLNHFFVGIWPPNGKEFALKGVQSRFEGETYKTLADEDRRRLDDSIIHAIIVKQDEPSDNASSIYNIFERLNTSGVTLSAQEIRASIFHGPFSQMLKELNAIQAWRAIYGPVNKLMRDQELILRFLALYYESASYGRPMKEFLNNFMGKNKSFSHIPKQDLTSVFKKTIETIYGTVGKSAFRIARVINAAVFDGVMVGVARRLDSGPIKDALSLRHQYEELLMSNDFLAVSERATADEESVSRRLTMATVAFADVQ